MRRHRPVEESDDIIIEGEAVQPVMVDYNIISMYMHRTPRGEMGCAANGLFLLVAGGLCLGISYLYSLLLSLVR
jgi:hypothetical protein